MALYVSGVHVVSTYDRIESLGEIDTNLGVLRRTADGDVGVGSSLEGSKSVTNDENGGAETAEGPVQDARPGDERANSVQAQTPDEDRLVAIVAEDPVGVAE